MNNKKINLNKVILSLSFTLFSLSANAKQVLPSELAGLNKCTKQECFRDDGGKEFLRLCSFMQGLPPYIAVMGPYFINDQHCYCPCTTAYLSGAARD